MKEKISEELNKISQMNKDQKWDYFKTYYLFKVIALVVGMVLLVWFIKDTFLQKKIANAGCVYGVEISEDEKLALTDGYLDYYGINKKKNCAYISTDNMFEGTEQQMDANAHEMALLAQIAAGEIYYLVLDRENLDMLSGGGIYSNLDEIFPNGLPENASDSAIELVNPETGGMYKAAIDLKNMGLFDGNKEAYLVFTVGIPDDEYPKKFLDYLISMK